MFPFLSPILPQNPYDGGERKTQKVKADPKDQPNNMSEDGYSIRA